VEPLHGRFAPLRGRLRGTLTAHPRPVTPGLRTRRTPRRLSTGVPVYAEHARRQLDEQHAALEERLTGLYRQLASSSRAPRTRKRRCGSRSASSTTSEQMSEPTPK